MTKTTGSSENIVEVAVKPLSERDRSKRYRLFCIVGLLVVLVSVIIILCFTVKRNTDLDASQDNDGDDEVYISEKSTADPPLPVGIITPPGPLIVAANDSRQYRFIRLNNSLVVTMISDRDSITGATCYNVMAGTLAEPDGYEGLAHYLEHMLFMGSEKYPKENTADNTASKYDGWVNAYTDDENTNYCFSVANEGLYLMADIFTQFFVEPRLSVTALEREMLAVDSEYMMWYNSNFWPSYQLAASLTNPDSPSHRFSTGSIETLNKTDIRDKLWDFYDRYYSANLITVVIIGNETLDTLQDWAETIFTAIPNKDRRKPVFNTLPFPPGDKRYINRLVYFKPKNDKHAIKIMFPLNIEGYPDVGYTTTLLGYEGKGSLYQKLSKEGYITSLVAGVYITTSNFNIIIIDCSLTITGLKNPKYIVTKLFQYIKSFDANGINKDLWEEKKKIDELKFRFKEKEDPAAYASAISATMAYRTDPRDYLEPPSRRKYNETLEKEIMKYMKPRNFNYYIGSSELSEKKATDYGPQLEKVEKWYQTAYTNTEIPEADIKEWENVALDPELHLPQPNLYIPQDFKIVPPPSTISNYSQNITPSDSNFKVWWYQDTVFQQPKTSIECQFYPKNPDYSPETMVKSELLYQTFGMSISEVLYPATLTDYSLDFGMKTYWALTISGFSDSKKVERILQEGIKSLLNLSFEKDETYFYNTIITPTKIMYKNIDNWQTTSIASNYLQLLQDDRNVLDASLADIADTMTQEKIETYRDNFLEDLAAVCSVSGNVDKEQAIKYVKVVEDAVTKGKTPSKDNRIGDKYNAIRKFPEGKTLIVRRAVVNAEQPNSAAIMSYQIGSEESNGAGLEGRPRYTRDVLLSLLVLALREPCFNYLRTQKQLGYVVHCYEKKLYGISTFDVMVQGSRLDAGPNVMAKEINTFIKSQYDKMSNDTDGSISKVFGSIKTALKKTLEEKPRSLSAKNYQLTSEIFSRKPNFRRREEMISALQSITITDFRLFYERYLLGDKRRQCSMEVYSKALTPPEEEKYDDTDIVVPNDVELATYRENNLTDEFSESD